MFVNKTKLNALMKQGYKGAGLKVFEIDDRYVINTCGIVLEIDKKKLDKEVKAQIIALAGELPDPTNTVNGYVAKDGSPLQYEMRTDNALIWDKATRLEMGADKTFAMIETNGRTYKVIQTETGKVELVNYKYIELLKGGKMCDDESNAIGPVCDGLRMYWYNNIMALSVPFADAERENVSRFCKDLEKCRFELDDERFPEE